MKKNLVPLLAIAFVVAIISTGIFYGLFVGRLNSATIGQGQTIVVAARNLDRGAVLQPEDVKLAAWGSPEVPKGAYTELSKVNGLTILSPIGQDEPVSESRVASTASGAAAGMGIAPGMRAVSIHAVDSSGVVSILRPGYKVDVQLVSNQSPELRTILQNIEVLSVNPQGDGRGNTPVVTLLVNPAGADMAGLGDSTARLRVILRNPLDDAAAELSAVTLPGILSRGAKK
jgi:pilus assembly protein CpaB